METFEPVIVAFCCHYCAYTAADMAGSQRLCYPANVKIIRVPCSGKVDAIHIVKAFEKGADGVYVAGCLEGDCHFKTGNIRAARRVAQVQKLLDEIGIGGERLEMVTVVRRHGRPLCRNGQEHNGKNSQVGSQPHSFRPSRDAEDCLLRHPDEGE